MSDTTLLRWLTRPRWWRQPPGPPGAPVVAAASTDSLTVTWSAPEVIAFDILRYELQYRVQGRGALLAHEAGGADTEATIGGLAEATTYEMRARAVNELGAGDWSDTAAGATRHPAPRFVEGEAATREVAENTPGGQKIGAPLTATSGAAAPRYALGGADAAAFDLDADTGQLRTRAGVSYDHERRSRYALTVTAAGPSGSMARIAVTVLITDVDEPPDAPAAPWVVEAGPTWLKLRWAAPGNTGPPIVDYDLEYRRSGRAFADAGHDGPATDADVTGLRPETRHTLRVRAVNDEGKGPWSPRASGDTTRVGTTNRPPRALPSLLTVEATATARGRVETFRAQDAFLDGDGEHLYIEAVSRDPSIASAAFEGAAVAVRPRAAGRATIAVTATDAHDHAAVATFDIDVREPAASDPAAELAGDTLTVSFTAFYELDEHRAYEVAFRQKSRAARGTSTASTPTTPAIRRETGTCRRASTSARTSNRASPTKSCTAAWDTSASSRDTPRSGPASPK